MDHTQITSVEQAARARCAEWCLTDSDSYARVRRLMIDAWQEAASHAVNAREAAHQHVAELTLARLAALIDSGHDERHAAHLAAAQVASDVAARPEQLHDGLMRSPVSGDALIDDAREARALGARVTDQDIDAATSIEERDMLIDLAASQHTLVALRNRSHAETAGDTAGLYLEYRQVHGHDPLQARAATWLDAGEGIRAEREIAVYRLAEATERRRSTGTSAATALADGEHRLGHANAGPARLNAQRVMTSFWQPWRLTRWRSWPRWFQIVWPLEWAAIIVLGACVLVEWGL
jgi:hypothetical protein